MARSDRDVEINPKMANRHGLISGATGTGKTVTLQVLAEYFSSIGVPVFMSDIKGDLSGVSKKGSISPKFQDRLNKLNIKDFEFNENPTIFWDVFGESGHPVRTTISEMGPLLLSRLLDLNDTQSAVLSLVFKIADDKNLLLLDIKDLRAMLDYVGKNAKDFASEYGLITTTSIGAIQRNLITLTENGGEKFFGEPALNITDLIKCNKDGRGYINILNAQKLMNSSRIYATFLLWLLAELFEVLPEVGDTDKPKMVFFFDEAHLLFNEAPKILLEKIEQVVRLIRSKGVGVYFITQNPLDIPDNVLAQLGNRVQHALRSFTPKDQKVIKAISETYRANPKFKTEQAITELIVGEALVSFLNTQGQPEIVEKALILLPHSQIGPVTSVELNELIKKSPFYGVYERSIDRESAYELLKGTLCVKKESEKTEQKKTDTTTKSNKKTNNDVFDGIGKVLTSRQGQKIIRNVFGMILKGGRF
ncbi:MAG TPA: DUF853 family protein [Spirochaetota bacterium]|nr:DUF853 family protein [Spirochaetota bacterium]